MLTPYRLMQKVRPLSYYYMPVLGLLLFAGLIVSCSSQTGSVEKTADDSRLAGTWVLTSRIIKGQDVPATNRLMKLVFSNNGTFRSTYRGDEAQKWIAAGAGGFSYTPPLLTLYWDSGPVVRITVKETDPKRLLFHHGRNCVPLKNQDPDEIFVRQKSEKGPTRQPS
ncbi:MAG: hypothetical protein WBG50_14715 [Desulfomonilaceae bacterium]